MKPSFITIEFKLNVTLNANSRDILKVNTEGRQGVKSILILIILKTTTRTKKPDI